MEELFKYLERFDIAYNNWLKGGGSRLLEQYQNEIICVNQKWLSDLNIADFDFKQLGNELRDIRIPNCEECERLICDVASSDIPNIFFCFDFLSEEEQLTLYTKHKRKNVLFGKSRWEMFAWVLIKRGYSQIKNELEFIFHWFKDRTWPGSGDLFDYLIKNHDNEIVLPLNKAIEKAQAENDTEWLNNLNMFKDEINA
jgi:hypothetical protein